MKIHSILSETFNNELADERLHINTLLTMAKEFMPKQKLQTFFDRYESITDEEDEDELFDAQIEALEELGDELERVVKQYYGKDFNYVYSKSEQPG